MNNFLPFGAFTAFKLQEGKQVGEKGRGQSFESHELQRKRNKYDHRKSGQKFDTLFVRALESPACQTTVSQEALLGLKLPETSE